MHRWRPGEPVTYTVERAGRRLVMHVQPGVPFPIFDWSVTAVTVLGYLLIGLLALGKRPGYLRARLLFWLGAAVAAELALPGLRSFDSPMLPISLLLNGFQMAVELHLASVIPERQPWSRRHAWVIPSFYVVGLASTGLVAADLLAEHAGVALLPWSSEVVYEQFMGYLLPLWALAVLVLLGRQALNYPEPRGRQQAAIVAAGVLPWALLSFLSRVGLLERWVPAHLEDVVWNSALLLYPLAVFIILLRESANQERILLDLTEEVQHAGSIAEISRIVSTDLHSAFHPKSTHVFYRERHSRDLTLGHSTGVQLAEEQIPESSVLLRLVEAYGKAVDYPEDLAGLPPEERAWLDRLEARLIVPLNGRDGRLLGLLLVGQKKSEEPFTVRDRKLLQALTNQIALVYENARLKDRVDQSQRVQREVLARLEEGELGLVRECPACGRCYDPPQTHCPEDRNELQTPLPVERLIAERYRLERRIDRGGMGAIYEATDLHLGRPVAVKVLHATLVGEEARRRFIVEARLTAALRHPNVVTVHDFGTTDTGATYLVMERLHGETLAALLRREGALPAAAVADLLEQACEGMQAAHRADIVHRDLKPANLYVAHRDDGSEALKILDFGVAKLRSDSLDAASGLTAPGALIGTFNYMAPEQLAGRQADPRSDVFALGVVTVEALTGHRPFAGEGPTELLRAIDSGEPRLDSPIAEDLRLATVLRRALAPDRERRYPSVDDLQRELIPAIRELARCAPSDVA